MKQHKTYKDAVIENIIKILKHQIAIIDGYEKKYPSSRKEMEQFYWDGNVTWKSDIRPLKYWKKELDEGVHIETIYGEKIGIGPDPYCYEVFKIGETYMASGSGSRHHGECEDWNVFLAHAPYNTQLWMRTEKYRLPEEKIDINEMLLEEDEESEMKPFMEE